jgi:hypothetical protein
MPPRDIGWGKKTDSAKKYIKLFDKHEVLDIFVFSDVYVNGKQSDIRFISGVKRYKASQKDENII